MPMHANTDPEVGDQEDQLSETESTLLGFVDAFVDRYEALLVSTPTPRNGNTSVVHQHAGLEAQAIIKLGQFITSEVDENPRVRSPIETM